MIEIGEKPILWHIMKYYSEFGYHDFVICLGYKQYVVKEFFADYFLHTSDVTFDLANNSMEVHNNYSEPWKVTLVDTGLNTMTGGRVKRIQPYIGNEPFMLTYGDGVSNVDLNELVAFHKSHGKIATITTVNLGQSKGVLNIAEDNTVLSFREKDDNDGRSDQWRFHGHEPGDLRLSGRRLYYFRAGTNAETGCRRPDEVLLSWRFLAVHGYPERNEKTGRTVAVRKSTMEDLERLRSNYGINIRRIKIIL